MLNPTRTIPEELQQAAVWHVQVKEGESCENALRISWSVSRPIYCTNKTGNGLVSPEKRLGKPIELLVNMRTLQLAFDCINLVARHSRFQHSDPNRAMP